MADSKGYVHFISDVPEDPDFLSKTRRHLVTSNEELNELLNNKYKDKEFMAFDIETSDLDPERGFLVGYSFAFDGIDGYYVPVKHAYPPSLGDESVKLIYDRMCKNKKNFIYNMMFDYNFMEYEGKLRSKYDYDMSKAPYYDLMVGFFLADTNVPFPGLKKMARKFLGWNMESFEATLGDNWNFYYLDPKDAYNYGALDSISTFALANYSIKFYKEAKLSGRIDNEFLYPFIQCLKEGVKHDTDYLKQMLDEQSKKIEELESEIYKLVGYQFRIGSNKELSEALLSLGIDTGKRTKPGYLKSDIETLLVVKRRNPHPLIDVLVEYKQLNKAVSSYTKTLYEYSRDAEDNRLRYCYHLYKVPTGRLACGKDGKNTYYTAINAQSIPKPHSKNWYVHDYKEGDKVNDGDRVVLDWRFSLVDKSDRMIEGLDPHWNMRDAFLPEDNSYWVSLDFSAEELRLIANYSKDPLWCETFISGGDLHKATAAKIFHKEVSEVTGDERKKAKSCYSINSFIYTDKGAIRARDLTNQYILDFKNHKQGHHSIIENRDGYRITLYNGIELEVTTDHKFLTYSKGKEEYVEAKDLLKGDFLLYEGIKVYGDLEPRFTVGSEFKSQTFHGDIVLDKDLAYVVGLMLGDGSIWFNDNGDVSKCGSMNLVTNKDNTDFVVSVLSKYGNPRVKHNKNYDLIYMSSRSFCEWLHQFSGRTNTKYINDVFYQCSRDVLLNLLAGLIDSDGSVSSRVRFRQTHKGLAKDVAKLVAFLGKRSSWTEERWNVNGKSGLCYVINIFGDNTDIPLRVSYKKKALISKKVSDTYRGCSSYKRLLDKLDVSSIPVKVINIEPIKLDAFIVNTDNHEIIGDSVLSHNCNFGLAYGMSPYTMVDRFNLSLSECEELHKGWWNAVPHIKAFQTRSIKQAKKVGTCYNYFGRPRRVKYYFQGDRKQQAFGERTVRNTMIQSMGADIVKLAIMKLYKNLFSNPKYKDKCRFLSTIHR